MEYRVINYRKELEPFLPALKSTRVLAVDTETTGLDPHCGSFSWLHKGFRYLSLTVTAFCLRGGNSSVPCLERAGSRHFKMRSLI